MCEGYVKGVCEGGQWGSSGGEVVPCGAVRCGAVRCGMMRCGAVGYDAVRYGTVVHGAVRCGVRSVRYAGGVCCGTVKGSMGGGQGGLAAPGLAR